MENRKIEEPAPKKKSGRRLLKIFAVLIALVMALIALLPTIVSTAPVRNMIVGKINASIEGKLKIESWSFGWFSGNSVSGIVFSDKARGIDTRVRSVGISKGLITLLGPTKKFGELIIESPETVIVTSLQPETRAPPPAPRVITAEPVAASTTEPQPPEEKPATAPAPAPGSSAPFILPVDLSGKIVINNGKAIVQVAGSKQGYEFEGLNATAIIESLNKPVTFDAHLSQVREHGRFLVAGAIKLFDNGRFDPDKFIADINLEATGLELQPFAALASTVTQTPNVKGVLNSRITAKINTLDNISVEGFAQVTNVVMSGAFLAADRPSLETVRLDFDATRQGKSVKIKNFKLYTPFITAAAEGELTDKKALYPGGSVTCNAKIDLARLAREFPATLRIARDVTISRGALFARLDIDSSGELVTCAASMKISNVEAARDKQALTLDSPVTLDGKALISREGPRLSNLQLSSAFAKAEGTGDMKDMNITLNADIALAMKEAGKFFDLGKIEAAGKLQILARIRSASDLEKNIGVTISAANLRISGISPSPFALESLKAGASVLVKTDKDGRPIEYADARLDIDSSPVTVKAAVAQVKPGAGIETLTARDASIRIRADAEELVALAQSMGAASRDVAGQGAVSLAMTAAMANGVVRLEPVSVTATAFRMQTEKGKSFSDPKISITGSAEADLSARAVKISTTKIILSSGEIDASLVRIADWKRKPLPVECEGKARINIARLPAQLPGYLTLREGASLAGGFEADFSIVPGARTRTVSLDGKFKDLVITSPSGAAVTEPVGKILLRAEQNTASSDLTFKNMRIVSSIVDFSAGGTYNNAATTKDLALNGTITCDFKKLSGIILSLTGTELEMEGKQEEKFSLKTSLAGSDLKSILRKTQGQAGLFLAKFKMFGLQLSDLRFNTSAGKGLITSDLNTRVNEGDLKIVPEIDASGEKAMLTIPDNSKILSGVKLTDEMMTGLIAKIHPLLKGCSVVAGQADLTLRKCSVPLDNTWTNSMNISGEMVFNDVVLTPGGVIGTLLEMTGLESRPVKLPRQTLTFSCADGRIEPSPLTIGHGDFKLTFSGYALTDGRLKFTAEVPVTEKMVGEKYFKYARNLTIKVPIEGTASKPEVSRQAFAKAVGGLVKDAAVNIIQEDGGQLLEELFRKKKKQQ